MQAHAHNSSMFAGHHHAKVGCLFPIKFPCTISCRSQSAHHSSSSSSSSSRRPGKRTFMVSTASMDRSDSEDQPQWVLPPAAWISEIMADLPSVDVDSMAAYNYLLQESLVLQPSLLMQPPRQAAASLVVLERCLRLSAVWLGPSAVSQLLASYNTSTLANHLSSLLGVWLGSGQVPHSFGQLWLEAPCALSYWDGPSFERHLATLQQEVPDIPIGRLLASSSNLAGVLLSLRDVSQLNGSVLKHGGYLIIAPHFFNISVQEEVADAGIDVVTHGMVINIYGCRKWLNYNACGEIMGVADHALLLQSERGPNACQELQAPDKPLSKEGLETSLHQPHNTQAHVTTQSRDSAFGGQAGDTLCDVSSVDDGRPILLMRLDVRPPSEVGFMPVIILPSGLHG